MSDLNYLTYPRKNFRNPGALDYQRMLAQTLLKSGADASPIQSNWQGAARIGQALVGGMLANQANRREAEQETERHSSQQATIEQAIRAATGWRDPDTGQVSSSSPPGGAEAYARVLAENPHTAPAANQMMMAQILSPEKFGSPVAGIGLDGKPAFMRPGERGSMAPVQGFSPLPKSATTGAQDANNFETRYARQRILALADKRRPGESIRDVIKRTTLRQSDSGRENPMYDQFIANDFRAASNRMVGDDPDFEKFMRNLDDRAPQQERRQQSTPKESGGYMDSAVKWLGGLLNLREDGAPATADQPPAAYPNARRAPDGHWYVEQDGKFFRVVQ